MIFQGSPSAAEGAASGEMAAPGASTPGETGGVDGSGHTGTLESAGARAGTAAAPLRRLLWAIAKSRRKSLRTSEGLSDFEPNFWIPLRFLAVFVKPPTPQTSFSEFGIHPLLEIFGRTCWQEETDTFHDRQSQIAERKSGDGRGPGDHSREAV
jgi:hypothetical protein